ncbi:MAG: 2,3-bisphosphoglycerate-independent phosphoglycerate mutase [Patescibacteria group bacterium]
MKFNLFKKKKEELNKRGPYNPVVLIILDGFGVARDNLASPWFRAKHPYISEIEKFYPFTTLQASGIAVGLPWGKEGNSEVGHLTIGAGKIIYNYLPKISNAIEDGSFFENESFKRAVAWVRNKNSKLHIIGLFSSGTVHANEEHLYALLEFAKRNDIKNTCLHLFTDGKDAHIKEGEKIFSRLEEILDEKYPNIKIVSVIGRKFAMDRNANWERTEGAYRLFVEGIGKKFKRASSYISEEYENGNFDGNTEPGLLEDSNTRINDNDAVIFLNFREDSIRQLTSALLEESFDKFPKKKLNNLLFVTMTEYDKRLSAFVAFESAEIDYPLARVISEAGFNQLHVAESEKYAHITYFLNGGREEPFEQEERVLIPSPGVISYNQAPEMSAMAIKDTVLSGLRVYNFIVVNFANADMVGHTGDFQATIKALEALDLCIGEIVPAILKLDGLLIITSDHGNAEEKLYKFTGEKRTMHSLNPVPFFLVAKRLKLKNSRTTKEIKKLYDEVQGTLSDVAPTVLQALGIKKPEIMSGQSLINKLI